MDIDSIKERVNQEIKELFPVDPSDEWFKTTFSDIEFDFYKEAWTKTIAEPFLNFINRGGKRMRPAFAILTAQAFGADDEIVKLAVIPEILHNGTLIVDDIEDHSHTRRGEPALHLMYNQSQIVNTGNFMYYYPQLIIKNSSLSSEKKLELYIALQRMMTNLHLGQAMDIYWSESNKRDVTIDEYLQMCTYKTGVMFAFCFEIGCIVADVPKETKDILIQAAKKFGLGFQINDDVANINIERDKANWHGKKDLYGDIREGKTTYLTAAALQKANEEDKEILIDILSRKTNDTQEILQAVRVIEKYNVIGPAHEHGIQYLKEAEELFLAHLPESESKNILLSILHKAMNK